MSLVGNLEDLGLGEILQIVSLSRKTGTLALLSRGREGSIVFRHGQVVRATSTTYQQSLGEILIQKGVIDLAILRKALALQQDGGFRERLGVILIKNFGVAREVVEEVVCKQIENVVFSLFAWVEGSFEFEMQNNIEAVDNSKLDPLQFMLDQGLNPQFLAMEGTRILDEKRYADEMECSAGKSVNDDIDFEFNLVDSAGKQTTQTSSMAAVEQPLVIVDDDGPSLQVIAEALRDTGFEVHAMTRSEDALITVDTLFRSGKSPTILIDLIMPKMDGSGVLGGVELLELLRNNFPDLPIIVMSDYHHGDAEKKVFDMGYPFIMKPRRLALGASPMLQNFLSLLLQLIRSGEAADTSTEWLEQFNLGDELRLELGDDDDMPTPAKSANDGGLSLLRGMLEDLNCPDLQGGVLLLVLRFASEFMNRAIIFKVDDNIISGTGQFGISGGKYGGDERVRSIHFPVESGSMFSDPYRTAHALTFKPAPTQVDTHIFEQLGGGVPEEIFIGPIISQSSVIGFLYGDNLPEMKPVGETGTLEIFLSQAGIAMEKSMLERQLYERVHQ
jgi:CheY-like chemotaxis protein